ncbi:MAG: hypothetical protein BWZ09_02769 [Alphaproteobacteria bacterium ADurb.BinA305]|nr:MAG: hypothetical protein BWZ09_02769 [Alphaproteobacteria bacterium ADurb.BinA305]
MPHGRWPRGGAGGAQQGRAARRAALVRRLRGSWTAAGRWPLPRARAAHPRDLGLGRSRARAVDAAPLRAPTPARLRRQSARRGLSSRVDARPRSALPPACTDGASDPLWGRLRRRHRSVARHRARGRPRAVARAHSRGVAGRPARRRRHQAPRGAALLPPPAGAARAGDRREAAPRPGALGPPQGGVRGARADPCNHHALGGAHSHHARRARRGHRRIARLPSAHPRAARRAHAPLRQGLAGRRQGDSIRLPAFLRRGSARREALAPPRRLARSRHAVGGDAADASVECGGRVGARRGALGSIPRRALGNAHEREPAPRAGDPRGLGAPTSR